jgi:ATP-dependent Lon protease
VVEQLLGKPSSGALVGKDNQIGVACGLAWVGVGGEVLFTEATLMDSKGQLTMTGKLGEVMQESHALPCRTSQPCGVYGINRDFYRKMDLHIHIPGAIPKDGPSAESP